MRVDFVAHPELAERYLILDGETGEPIENVARADDAAGHYETFKLRPRSLSDPPGTDLRLRDQNGEFILEAHQGQIEIVTRSEHPLKGEFMALLDDPDVVRAIRKHTCCGWLARLCGGPQ